MPPPPLASEPATAPAPLPAIRYGMMAMVMALTWELKSWRNGDVVKWNGSGERKESFNRLRNNNINNKRKIKLIECKVSTTIDYVVGGEGGSTATCGTMRIDRWPYSLRHTWHVARDKQCRSNPVGRWWYGGSTKWPNSWVEFIKQLQNLLFDNKS